MPLSDIVGQLPAVAREALEAHLGGRPLPRSDAEAPPAGVFVTLRNPDGSLRGCVGSVQASEPDVVHETQRSAILAATRDPRFIPVGPEELDRLTIEVSVLSPDEPVSGPAELDPHRYGVIVRDALGRRGLLLPDIEGVDTVERQLDIARQKAGIARSEPVAISRFSVLKSSDKGRG